MNNLDFNPRVINALDGWDVMEIPSPGIANNRFIMNENNELIHISTITSTIIKSLMLYLFVTFESMSILINPYYNLIMKWVGIICTAFLINLWYRLSLGLGELGFVGRGIWICLSCQILFGLSMLILIVTLNDIGIIIFVWGINLCYAWIRFVYDLYSKIAETEDEKRCLKNELVSNAKTIFHLNTSNKKVCKQLKILNKFKDSLPTTISKNDSISVPSELQSVLQNDKKLKVTMSLYIIYARISQFLNLKNDLKMRWDADKLSFCVLGVHNKNDYCLRINIYCNEHINNEMINIEACNLYTIGISSCWGDKKNVEKIYTKLKCIFAIVTRTKMVTRSLSNMISQVHQQCVDSDSDVPEF